MSIEEVSVGEALVGELPAYHLNSYTFHNLNTLYKIIWCLDCSYCSSAQLTQVIQLTNMYFIKMFSLHTEIA